MINDTGRAVIQIQEKHKEWKNGQKTSWPLTQHKEGAEVPVYEGCIVKRLADSNIIVIGNGS